jgi:hypothetical protein
VYATLKAVEIQFSLAIGWPYQIFNSHALSALTSELHE